MMVKWEDGELYLIWILHAQSWYVYMGWGNVHRTSWVPKGHAYHWSLTCVHSAAPCWWLCVLVWCQTAMKCSVVNLNTLSHHHFRHQFPIGKGRYNPHNGCNLLYCHAHSFLPVSPLPAHSITCHLPEFLVEMEYVAGGVDEHAPTLGSKGGIRETLGRDQTALDEYQRHQLIPNMVGPYLNNGKPPRNIWQHLG